MTDQKSYKPVQRYLLSLAIFVGIYFTIAIGSHMLSGGGPLINARSLAMNAAVSAAIFTAIWWVVYLVKRAGAKT